MLLFVLQVSPQCDCQHNTAGTNCERCHHLFNDLPWRPAEEGDTHTCQRKTLRIPQRRPTFLNIPNICSFASGCECNNHARQCHFDPAVYEASGRRGGGVCEDCAHHTTGPKCDRCSPGYQPNPRSQMDRPDACIRKRFTRPLQSVGAQCGLCEHSSRCCCC